MQVECTKLLELTARVNFIEEEITKLVCIVKMGLLIFIDEIREKRKTELVVTKLAQS